MRIGNDRSQDEPHIDLVPLIDVILVLIIFFVVTTTFDARSTLQVQLPTASQQPSNEPPRSLSVLINAEGRYFINDQEVLRSDVRVGQADHRIGRRQRPQPARAAARRRTHPYQAVVTAQDALGQLGFRRIAIATAPEVRP